MIQEAASSRSTICCIFFQIDLQSNHALIKKVQLKLQFSKYKGFISLLYFRKKSKTMGGQQTRSGMVTAQRCTSATWFGYTQTCSSSCCGKFSFKDGTSDQTICLSSSSSCSSSASSTFFISKTPQTSCYNQCSILIDGEGGCIQDKYSQACDFQLLSVGAIVGIVIGSIAILVLIFCFIRACQRRQTAAPTVNNPQSGTSISLEKLDPPNNIKIGANNPGANLTDNPSVVPRYYPSGMISRNHVVNASNS